MDETTPRQAKSVSRSIFILYITPRAEWLYGHQPNQNGSQTGSCKFFITLQMAIRWSLTVLSCSHLAQVYTHGHQSVKNRLSLPPSADLMRVLLPHREWLCVSPSRGSWSTVRHALNDWSMYYCTVHQIHPSRRYINPIGRYAARPIVPWPSPQSYNPKIQW